MINGAFPRHSVSTSSNTNSNDCYYRHSLDDDRLGTPQRVHRKPVPRQSPVQENNWKIATKKKDYSAADTIHPNRICTYNQVKPSQEKASQPTRPHSLQPQSTQPRHHPQKHKSSSVPLVASSVTPAVEVPPPQKLKQSASAIPGAMDQVVVRIRKYSQGSSITPNFWYPRADRDITEPVKQALTKKIRGLLQPHRIQIEGASKDVNQKDIEASIARPKTPTQKTMDNPFNALRHTWNVSDNTGLSFHEDDFSQVDTYASTVQQRGPLLTPMLLSQKFLTRPYHRNDLFKLRVLFVWLVQNIRPEYHQNRQHDLRLLKMKEQQQQKPVLPTPSKSSNLRQRLGLDSSIPDIQYQQQQQQQFIDQINLNSIDLLQEESHIITSILEEEDAADVLESRSCRSAAGMANLFYEMAIASGIQDCRVVYGHLKAPKDEQEVEPNHAWCSVKIDGEYRFIDCWLASPFNPQNENKMEPHWFLTIPQDMIMTHYPQQSLFQYLDPALSPEQFFHLPYVRNPFFWYQLKVTKLSLVHEQEGIFYLCLCVPSNTSCYAETEVEGMTVRGLAQCLTDARDNRICKIKAVLPPGQTHGHLKIYAGPRISQQNEPIDKHHYPLALSLRVSTEHPETPFSFVKLFTAHNEFYIQEPQCQFLYPLQNYHFCIRNVGHRMAHHKLAVKSPGGRLYKLMYYPQDQTYDANVTVSEAGKWTLICLLHHTGGWYNVANWTCIVK